MAVNFAGIATFIHIPKCAGTSITEWAKTFPKSNNQQKHVKVLQARSIWANHGRFFTVIRDPWDRAVSLYHYLGQLATGKISTPRQYAPYPRWRELYGSSIEEFLKAIRQRDKSVDVPDGLWHIWDSQTSWIDPAEDPVILKYENLDQDFKIVKDLLNHHAPLPRLNVSDHQFYAQYYDRNTVQLVREIWAEDIERFGYHAP